MCAVMRLIAIPQVDAARISIAYRSYVLISAQNCI